MLEQVRLTQQEAEQLLFHEARLIDSRQLEEWADLFTPDGIYWLPIDEDADPTLFPSLIYDDAERRSRRVYQMLYTPMWSQRPPSTTVHFITNVTVKVDDQRPHEVFASCSLLCHEIRGGDDHQYGLGVQQHFAGRCDYRLRYSEESGWKIALKKVVLISRYLPQHNLSFII
jgi:benzoate/toluate 1,2-dioxygenase beta subunit